MEVRRYQPLDERGWLRCRALSFLESAYFDDVLTAKPSYAQDAVELVAVERGSVVGVLDVSLAGNEATIETVGTHPDHARRGIATAMFREALPLLPTPVVTLDAWTRDDAAANGWYQRCGFEEEFKYLHVYASSDAEVADAVADVRHGLALVRGFFHASIESEEALRLRFGRVHVCRRYVRREL